jgi:hypothetical protein
MQVRLPGRRTVVAHAFPSTDHAFAAMVSSTLDAERGTTTDAAELREAVNRSLRRAYPNARVVVQAELGQLLPTQETWYAYRDAAVRPRSEQRDHLYDVLAAARQTIAATERVLHDCEDAAGRAGYGRRREPEHSQTPSQPG